MTEFKIGEIYIDKEGIWSVTWVGTHNDQGGPSFTTAEFRSDDLKELIDWVYRDMLRCKSLYITEIDIHNTGAKNGN